MAGREEVSWEFSSWSKNQELLQDYLYRDIRALTTERDEKGARKLELEELELELDELELDLDELEVELEELEGSSLLGWRIDTLTLIL